MNIALLIVTALLTVAALVISFFFGSEMLRLLRDLFSPPSVRGQQALESELATDGSPRTGDRARRNRATVERMISHFEDKETRSVPGKES
jgi:hypothetical protein